MASMHSWLSRPWVIDALAGAVLLAGVVLAAWGLWGDRISNTAPAKGNFSRRQSSNIKMKIFTLLVAATLLVGGCDARSRVAQPASRSTAEITTQPNLRAVDLRHGVYLARIEIHTTITPDGLMRSVRIDGKSYGPSDIDAKQERTEIRQGHLTPAQISELAALFAGWEALSDERYGGVTDGGDIQVRYGDKTVAGGSATPKQVWDVYDRISELTAMMPVVKK
jgi:hypothetical protein